MTPSSLARLGLGFLAGCVLVATPLSAGEGGFSNTLSMDQREAAGLNLLDDDEHSALDQLVAGDLALARREELTALDDTFLARHSEVARKLAGLDRLSSAQLAKLNELVAAAIAARPTPKERPRLKDSDVLAKNRGQIHGSVTVAYGWGAGGRDFRAGSVWLDYYDPENRVGVGLGLSSFDGDGFWGYSPGYSQGRYYPASFDYTDYDAASPAYFSRGGRGGFHGDGACFRGVAPGGRGGGFRH